MLWIFYFLIRRIFSKQLQWRRHIRYSGYFAFPLTSRSSVPIPISVEIFSSIYFQIQNISLQPNLTNFKNSFLILETLNISETNGDLCDLMHDPQSHTPIPTQPNPVRLSKEALNVRMLQNLHLRNCHLLRCFVSEPAQVLVRRLSQRVDKPTRLPTETGRWLR